MASLKGGTGKTTMTVCLGEALARQGQDVLLIDYDGQANMTQWVLGRNLHEDEASILDVVAGDWTLAGAADRADGFGVDFIGGTSRLFRIEQEMAQDQYRHKALQGAVRNLQESREEAFDYCLIDCPPALGLPVTQALLASDSLLIPTLLEKMAVEGLKDLTEAKEKARNKGGADVELLGVVPNDVHPSRNMTDQIATVLENRFSETFLRDYKIPVRTRISEASALSKPLKEHCTDRGSSEYERFDELANFVLSRTN